MSSTKLNTADPSRILICGLGSIGCRHVRLVHEQLPSTSIAVVRSGFGSKQSEEAIIDQHFSRLEEAIEWKPDAAIIASPASCHQQQALSLAREGIPLLLEKPVGTGGEPAESWVELRKRSDRLPMLVGYVLRYDPCAAVLKENIQSERLGKVLEADFYCGSWLPDWRPKSNYRQSVSAQRSLGGGVLLEISHELDLAHFFLGSMKLRYSCLRQSRLLELDVEDQALLVTASDSCPLITFRLNFCTRPARRMISMRFEKGEAFWDILAGTVSVRIHGQEGEYFQSQKQTDDLYRIQLEHFVSCLHGELPVCSLSDGLRVLDIVTQAKADSHEW